MIIGHQKIFNELQKRLAENKFPQTSLFYGRDGSGKKTVALALAKTLLVRDDNSKALFAKEQHPDLHIIAPTASKTSTSSAKVSLGTIKTEQIQSLKKKISFPPLLADHQVIIIDNAHLMTTVTANSLLKILEEPKPHQIFILVTASLHKILVTIRSRAAKFHFADLKPDEVLQILKDQLPDNSDVHSKALSFLLECFPGSPALVLKALAFELEESFVEEFLKPETSFVKIQTKIQSLLKKSVDLKMFFQILRTTHLKSVKNSSQILQKDLLFFEKLNAAERQIQQHIQDQFVLENLLMG